MKTTSRLLLTVTLACFLSSKTNGSIESTLKSLETALSNLSGALQQKMQEKLSIIVSLKNPKWLNTNALEKAFKLLHVPIDQTVQEIPKKQWHITLATLHIPIPKNISATSIQKQLLRYLMLCSAPITVPPSYSILS